MHQSNCIKVKREMNATPIHPLKTEQNIPTKKISFGIAYVKFFTGHRESEREMNHENKSFSMVNSVSLWK